MLDASLKRQLDAIWDNHRTRTTGESLARGSRASYQKAFEDFVEVHKTVQMTQSLFPPERSDGHYSNALSRPRDIRTMSMS